MDQLTLKQLGAVRHLTWDILRTLSNASAEELASRGYTPADRANAMMDAFRNGESQVQQIMHNARAKKGE